MYNILTLSTNSEEEIISQAVKALSGGGILVYPTETCYGVGVDATNPEAVEKVLKYKKRPEGKPISVGCYDLEMASKYVKLNDKAREVYKTFLPGPVTVISESNGIVDKRLVSEKGTLGIRVPDYPLLLDIIKAFGKPITTTSANSSGKKTPYKISDIVENMAQKQLELVDLMLDAGTLPKNSPSTVIDTTTEELTTYRAGAISFDNKGEKHSSGSVEETISLAKTLTLENYGESTPLVFLLHGDLGAGKTHFVKGIAEALGIERTVKSPTYTYFDEYPFGLEDQTLYHLDAWRLTSMQDVETLRIKKWFKPGNVIAIEWPEVLERVGFDLPGEVKTVRVDIDSTSGTGREITLS